MTLSAPQHEDWSICRPFVLGSSKKRFCSGSTALWVCQFQSANDLLQHFLKKPQDNCAIETIVRNFGKRQKYHQRFQVIFLLQTNRPTREFPFLSWLLFPSSDFSHQTVNFRMGQSTANTSRLLPEKRFWHL